MNILILSENDNHSNACIEVGTEAAEVEDELAMTNGHTVSQNLFKNTFLMSLFFRN